MVMEIKRCTVNIVWIIMPQHYPTPRCKLTLNPSFEHRIQFILVFHSPIYFTVFYMQILHTHTDRHHIFFLFLFSTPFPLHSKLMQFNDNYFYYLPPDGLLYSQSLAQCNFQHESYNFSFILMYTTKSNPKRFHLPNRINSITSRLHGRL